MCSIKAASTGRRSQEAAEPPYFIPENTPLNTQLLYFQRQKKRLGMVVDEYGDILGLVALEDILEEIVGEFTSNLVEENEEITRTPGWQHHLLGHRQYSEM